MRREIALRYADKIAQRLHSVNGVLATPLCSQEAVRFKRVWVFGSTAKGAESPNDLDLLIEAEGCGRQRSWRQTRYDKDARRRFGYKMTVMATDEALKWLTKGMKNVSRHMMRWEQIPIDVKVLIYPRNDLNGRWRTDNQSIVLLLNQGGGKLSRQCFVVGRPDQKEVKHA